MKRTENELIHIGKPIPFDTGVFLHQLEELAKASYENSEDIVQMVEAMVPTFHPAGEESMAEIKRALDEAAVASADNSLVACMEE